MISIAIPWNPHPWPFVYPLVSYGAFPRYFNVHVVQTMYAIVLHDIAVREIVIRNVIRIIAVLTAFGFAGSY